MKRSVFLICILLSFSCLLGGCNAEHTHQWQDVSGEHARICTDCNEKQLKPEACNFVSVGCGQPLVCTVCAATSDENAPDHDWKRAREEADCWSTTVSYACSNCDMEKEVHSDLALPNHSWAEETADGKTTFTCTRCNESYTFPSEIAAFSYAQVLEKHKIGDPGVKHENFHFSWESDITAAIDAIIRAKFELTVAYDTVTVSLDPDANVWCVRFSTSSADTNWQSVYIKGNGLPCYVVSSTQ